MNSIEGLFKDSTVDLFDSVYGVSVKGMDDEEKGSISFGESILYLKSIKLAYGEIRGVLCVAFSKDFLKMLEKKSEKEVQSFFPILSHDLLFSNVMGLIVYAANTKLKPIYSGTVFDLPVDVSIRKFLAQNRVLALSQRGKHIAYVGFSFS